MAREIKFGVLGVLHLSTGGTTHVPRGPKLNKILALLLMRANQVVEVDALIDELWDDNPPRRGLATVRTHVYHLRRQLAEQFHPTVQDLIVTQPPGYLLTVGQDDLDASRFTALTAEARRLQARGRAAEASTAAAAGLALWHGPALANVSPGRLLAGHVRRLEELRIQALTVRIEAELSLGRHRALLPELRDLVARYPLNEWFHTRLIEVLLHCERRAEALQVLRELHSILDDELGLSPSPELLGLEARILGTELVSAS